MTKTTDGADALVPVCADYSNHFNSLVGGI